MDFYVCHPNSRNLLPWALEEASLLEPLPFDPHSGCAWAAGLLETERGSTATVHTSCFVFLARDAKMKAKAIAGQVVTEWDHSVRLAEVLGT